MFASLTLTSPPAFNTHNIALISLVDNMVTSSNHLLLSEPSE